MSGNEEQLDFGLWNAEAISELDVAAFIEPPDTPQSPPKQPEIYCYCCGNKIENAVFSWGWGREHYDISGKCCGKFFTAKVSYKDIREGRADTYVVNLS